MHDAASQMEQPPKANSRPRTCWIYRGLCTDGLMSVFAWFYRSELKGLLTDQPGRFTMHRNGRAEGDVSSTVLRTGCGAGQPGPRVQAKTTPGGRYIDPG